MWYGMGTCANGVKCGDGVEWVTKRYDTLMWFGLLQRKKRVYEKNVSE